MVLMFMRNEYMCEPVYSILSLSIVTWVGKDTCYTILNKHATMPKLGDFHSEPIVPHGP